MFLIRVFILVILFALPALADCIDPAAPEGAIYYNSTHKVFQGCTGTEWYAFSGSGRDCGPPPACPDVGDVCPGDGSGGGNPVFAGCICYHDAGSSDAGNCKAVYVTQDNQGTSAMWKTSVGTDDIANDSMEDGRVNHSQVIARADYIADPNTFPAFKLCEELTDGGYSDWYLPAQDELHLLWKNRVAINAGASGNFTTDRYWSSAEYDTGTSWSLYFSDGNHNRGHSKRWSPADIRCVRR